MWRKRESSTTGSGLRRGVRSLLVCSRRLQAIWIFCSGTDEAGTRPRKGSVSADPSGSFDRRRDLDGVGDRRRAAAGFEGRIIEANRSGQRVRFEGSRSSERKLAVPVPVRGAEPLEQEILRV